MGRREKMRRIRVLIKGRKTERNTQETLRCYAEKGYLKRIEYVDSISTSNEGEPTQ